MFNVPSFWSLSKFLKFIVWLTDKILKMLQWNKEKQENHHVWQFVTSKWFVFLAGERLTDKYYHSIKKSAQIVLWTNWVSFIWLTIWRLIFPHKQSYLKENRFLDKLSPRVLGFSDFLSTGQKRRKIYFQKIFLEGDFFPCMIQMFQSLKVGRWNLLHNRLSQIQNASTSLERLLGFLPHPGKCFQLKSCRGSNWNHNCCAIPRHQRFPCDSLLHCTHS